MPFDTSLLEPASSGFDENLLEPAKVPAGDALRPSLWSRLLSGAGRGAVAQLSVPTPGTEFPTGQAPTPAELHATGSRFMAGTVNLPYVEHPPIESVPGAIAREAWNVGLGIPEFIGSPEGMLTAQVGGAAPRVVAGGFSALTGVQAGQQLRQLVREWPTMTAPQRAAAVTRFGLTAGLSGVLGKQALKRPASVQPAAAAAQPEVSPSAIQERGAEALPVAETPRVSEEVGAQVRVGQEPAVPQEPTTPVPQEVAKPPPPVTGEAPEAPAREAASAGVAETAPVAAGAEQPAKATVSQPTTESQAAPEAAAAPAAAPAEPAKAVETPPAAPSATRQGTPRENAMSDSEFNQAVDATVQKWQRDLSAAKGKAKSQLESYYKGQSSSLSAVEREASSRLFRPPMKGMGATIPEGPGAATPGGVGAKAEIEQLHDAMRNVRGARVPLSEQVKQAFDVGQKWGEAKGILSGALNGLAAVGHKIKLNWRGYPTVDALLKAKGQLSAELETRSWRARKFEREVKKNIPSARDRAAITKWIEADGDAAALAAAEARVPNEFKQAYRDAANLSPDLKIAAQNVQNFFEARLQDAIDAGVLEHGVSDYIHRIYQSNPSLMKRALAYVQSGILSANPGLARKRIFKLDADAEAAGFKPVQDFLPRVLDYETSLSKAIASREFIKKLVDMDAADGRPILGVKGVGLPVEDAAGVRTGTVIKPKGNFSKANDPADAANYRGDYKDREYPALSKWKWVGADTDGKPIFLQGNVAIHPDYVSRIDALLKPSAIREYAIGRGALGVGAAFKQTMLDFSMFHQVQISLHAMEHRVNPFNIVKDIDFQNPNVQKLLEGGVTLGGEYRATNYGEGLVGSSLSRHIPFLGEKMAVYHQFLFQDYIPRIKMSMALHALERNRARYAKDLASGRMTEDQLYSKTASQANAAFGELNYTMLERSKTIQDVARLVFLAPDFLEARTRFAAEAFTKGAGKAWSNEQRSALFLGALAMWTMARIGNMLLDGQPHDEPENLFSIVHGKHSYSLRTVQGDILHLLSKRLQFIMNRLNPVYTKPLFELATKRDQFGRPRSGWEIAKDTISNIVPISLRSGRERSIYESLAAGFGVNARRWNEVDRTFDLAKKWKQKHGISEPGEFIYDSEKDPLRPLKVALSNGDEADAALQIKKLVESKERTLPKLYQHFQRYSTMPFTGSFANDRKFVATLSDDQKKTYEASKEYKKQIFKLYMKAVGIYKANIGIPATPTAPVTKFDPALLEEVR